VLALVAVALFDTIAIASARLSVTSDANSAAEAANGAFNQGNGDVDAAYAAAKDYAEAHGDTLVPRSFTITRTGVVNLKLQGRATTMVVRHIGPLKKLADTVGKGSATTPNN
jgi:hypothetical protein